MLRAKDGDFFITDWLRNRNTLEFLGAWEGVNNPSGFNYGEFAAIKSQSGLNSFKVSVKEWVERTGAIGIYSTAGRYGGTFAHNIIALEFGTWISPVFKLYLLTEFKRLKEIESNSYNLEWNVKRVLSKVNYRLHTDAIKAHLLPKLNVAKDKEWIEYAKEADLINVAVFGCTAQMWNHANPQAALNGGNMRDSASINELAVLSNIESLNSVLIEQGMTKKERFYKLKDVAESQMKALNKEDFIKSIKYTSDTTYPIALQQVSGDEKKSEFDTHLKGILKAGKPIKESKKLEPDE